MEFGFEGKMPFRRNRFGFVTGTIVELVPTKVGNRRADGCMLFTTVEDMDGNTVNFVVTPSTYVVDFDTLSVGMQCTFWYAADAPAPLIYPPQYSAVVAARERNGRMVSVGYFDLSMVNEDRTLQLNLDGSVMGEMRGCVSDASFMNILILDGHGTICNYEEKLEFQKGDSFFLPAGSGNYRIEGVCDGLITTIRKEKV